jgi:hypothetical protein
MGHGFAPCLLLYPRFVILSEAHCAESKDLLFLSQAMFLSTGDELQ